LREQTVPIKVFTKQFRDRASALGLPLAEVARRAGLSDRRFGHHTTGRSETDLASLLRIVEALNCTPNELLEVTDTDLPTDKLG
jgi:DNA-binding Xre family transcriptional regulator